MITYALFVDFTNLLELDGRSKDRRIVGVGKAGSPDVVERVVANMVVRPTIQITAGKGLILTCNGLCIRTFITSDLNRHMKPLKVS